MPDNILKWISEGVENQLHDAGLNHLKTGVRGKSIVVYSESDGNKENRCRFTQISGQIFVLGMADHNGKWETTPFEGKLDELLDMVKSQFPENQ